LSITNPEQNGGKSKDDNFFSKKKFNANFAVEKYNYNSKIIIIIILNYNSNSKLFLLCSGFVIVGKIIVSKISWWDLKTKQN